MSRIFLLRHAHSTANANGILAGRLPNIALSKEGLKQRDLLQQRFAGAKFQQVISSPITRCVETINFLEIQPTIEDDFQEVDYGDWSGKKMSALMRKAAWREIHKTPSSVRFPNGETLPEVQIRAIKGLDLATNHKAKNLLISTHADVVKVLLLHALGTHLNNIDKIQIDNASVSIIDRGPSGLRVIKVNDFHTPIKDLLL